MASDSRELEILVAKIQAQLAPDAEVIHDARLNGRKSNRSRQIDVLVRQKIGQYEMLIVLDCKDYARPVDVKGVEEFYGLLDDVGANKGALVCPRGFTPAAKTRATGYQIDLYSPIDTDPHKWQALVAVPVMCDFRGAAIAFKFECTAPVPLKLPGDYFSSVVAYSVDHQRELGTPIRSVVTKWNDGIYPIEPGEHNDLPIFDTPEVLTDNGYGQRVPVQLTASIVVTRKLYFGRLPIKKISGFKDELSGAVIANAFTTGIFDPDDVMRNWQVTESEETSPVRPTMILSGLIAWDVADGERFYF
jgi:hypothetical protein